MDNDLQAMEAAGKDPATTLIGGAAGDDRVGELIASGDSLYKASVSFNIPVIGTAVGNWAADWIEGKNVAQLAVVHPFVLTNAETFEEFTADLSDPEGVFADPERFAQYIELLGTVKYAERDNIWDETDPSNATN